jgi:hypothetical protein
MKMELKPYSKEVTSLKSGYHAICNNLYPKKLKMINNWATIRSLIGSMMTTLSTYQHPMKTMTTSSIPNVSNLSSGISRQEKMMWAFE